MAICPNCNYEYVEGVTICPDCGAALVDPESIEKQEEWTEKNWEVVYTSDNEYEVEMIKNNFDSAGIISEILVQKDSNFPAPGDLGVIKLLVRKEDVQAALNYINRIMNKSKEDESE
jgi:hypothetical protein